MKSILYVALGGALGSVLRYVATLCIHPKVSFPLATFLINISGSFLIGVLAGYFLKNNLENENLRLLLITGLCGGFTTFSTFSLDSLKLIQSGQVAQATLYIATSVVVCIVFTFIGFQLTSK